jgi:hypothetical protein
MVTKTRTICLIVVLTVALVFLSACQSEENEVRPTETPPQTREVVVYFQDEQRYVDNIEPYEVGVTRTILATEDEAEALLRLVFEGPTEDEYAAGLRAYPNGCTGFSGVEVRAGIAHVYLTGDCNSGGATYTIANLIFVNLKQLDSISSVKIYDQYGQTGSPEGEGDSIPFSLEP